MLNLPCACCVVTTPAWLDCAVHEEQQSFSKSVSRKGVLGPFDSLSVVVGLVLVPWLTRKACSLLLHFACVEASKPLGAQCHQVPTT
jgi:hypothetical protein